MHDFKALLLISLNKWIKVDYGICYWSAPIIKKKSKYATAINDKNNVKTSNKP